MLALIVWLVLAVIGALCAGFWGFLGVAFLYVVYYAVTRPRVTVITTPAELEHARMLEESRRAATRAILLDKASKALAPRQGHPAPRVEEEEDGEDEAPRRAATTDRHIKRPAARIEGDSWVCSCGTRNALKRTQCRNCNAWSPE